MKRKLFLCALCLVGFVVLLVPKGVCDNETAANVTFQIFTGSGSSDCYSGDYFWYNITLQNSGTTVINTTFTVTVLNTPGGVIGEIHIFDRNLAPNDTTYLYPNYTRLGKDEVSIYFMDTAGTYTIELTSSLSMYYYRWYGETGRYTVEPNVCTMNIDAMPSYERQQNDAWNQYLQNNQDYMNSMKQYVAQSETYVAQSKTQASKTENLAVVSIFIAMLSLLTSYGTLTRAARERLGVGKYVLVCEVGICLIVLIAVLFT